MEKGQYEKQRHFDRNNSWKSNTAFQKNRHLGIRSNYKLNKEMDKQGSDFTDFQNLGKR